MGKALGPSMKFISQAVCTSHKIEKVWGLRVFVHRVNLSYSGAILQCSESYKYRQGYAQYPRTLTQASNFIRWTLTFKT